MDAADKAQAQAEWLEQYRAAHRRKHVMRASPYCRDCGTEIEAERLKAILTSERCVYCQEDHERFNKQYGS